VSVVGDSVRIPAAGVELEADVGVPPSAASVVGFVHSSGSSRHSPRHRYVAAELQAAGLATVLTDLLTPVEEVEDAPPPSSASTSTCWRPAPRRWSTGWATASRRRAFDVGLLRASTEAAAALVAAAQRPAGVEAIESRGGRPDLAGEYLASVNQPTPLIVGARDPVVLHQQAMTQLADETHPEIVPGESHLFPEPGALEQIARLAWFVRHLKFRARRPPR
jgi:predicted alpha/beta-hydrolase family hydrolase